MVPTTVRVSRSCPSIVATAQAQRWRCGRQPLGERTFPQHTPTNTRHFSPVCCHHKNQVTISSQIPYHVKLLAQISSPSAQTCPPGERYHFRKARLIPLPLERCAHTPCHDCSSGKGKETRTRREKYDQHAHSRI
jgi:hypothetical protein